MNGSEKERCVLLGEYVAAHRATVRCAAKEFGISKSTVHKDCTDRLKQLNEWRKCWADLLNREFERQYLDIRVSQESLAAQGIHREPTIHLGARTIALEAKNIRTDRGNRYRDIFSRNKEREQKRLRNKNHSRLRLRGRSR